MLLRVDYADSPSPKDEPYPNELFTFILQSTTKLPAFLGEKRDNSLYDCLRGD